MVPTALTAAAAVCGAAGGDVAGDSPSEAAPTPAASVTACTSPGDPRAAVTAPVGEKRLKPSVDSPLPAAIGLLT